MVAIFDSIHKRINARGQDLLVIEADTTTFEHLVYTVRFSHRTVRDFLSKPDMLKKLNSWKSDDFDPRATLCKSTLAIVKSLPLSTDMTNKANANRCWNHISDFFAYAGLIEVDEGTLDDLLVDEFQRVFSSFGKRIQRDTWFERLISNSAWALDHWAHWVDENDMGPVGYSPRYDGDMTSFFFAMAVEANLKRYIKHKLEIKPQLMNRAFLQRPILDRALRPPRLTWRTSRVDPDMIHLLLTQGADPNEVLTVYNNGLFSTRNSILYTPEKAWTTPWALFLQRLHKAKISKVSKTPEQNQDEIGATKLMIENGAVADLRPWKILALPSSFSGSMLTPTDIFHDVFPPRDAAFLEQLLRKRRPWILRRWCSLVRRIMLLWFYRDIDVVVWSLILLRPIFFNDLFGVILPMVIIPTVAYFSLLVWHFVSPFFSFVASSTAPVLLSALILSDWIPIFDGLIWVNKLLVWRNASLHLKND